MAESIITLNAMEQRVINTGPILNPVFAGDIMMNSFWCIGMNLNLGGLGDGTGNASYT